jgi:hypothetical protein
VTQATTASALVSFSAAAYVKGAVLAGAVGIAGVSLVHVLRHRAEAPVVESSGEAPRVAVVEHPVTQAAAEPTPVVAPSPEDDTKAAPPHTDHASSAPSLPAASAHTADTLAEEAAQLERARAELASDPRAALSTLDAYTRRYPKGQLGAERELIAIEALQRLGRPGAARARGEAFIAKHPKSLYVARIRKLLGEGS